MISMVFAQHVLMFVTWNPALSMFARIVIFYVLERSIRCPAARHRSLQALPLFSPVSKRQHCLLQS
jgi:hypothetical protein